MIDALMADAGRYQHLERPVALIFLALRHRGFRATTLYRLGRTAQQRKMPLLGPIIMRLMHHLCHCEISLNAEIAPGLLLPHPMGIIIGEDVRIGRDCTIQQHVTLGGNYWREINGRQKPILGRGVAVSAGAVIAGPVTVGDRARIGANAVVTRDVPAWEPNDI
jgi:serine O-acetyltransferase